MLPVAGWLRLTQPHSPTHTKRKKKDSTVRGRSVMQVQSVRLRWDGPVSGFFHVWIAGDMDLHRDSIMI
jgi:hypothetical protein